MPIINNETSHLNELIGLPPRQLALLAICSFIGLTAIFLILFFVVHFQYTYNGVIYVNYGNPKKLILALPNRSEVDINRIKNGELLIRINHTSKFLSYPYQGGKGKIYLGKNQFMLDNKIKLIREYNSPCVVYLTSLTLYQRFIHKYYK